MGDLTPGLGYGQRVLFDGNLEKAPKGTVLPRWNRRRARLYRETEGHGHFLTWSSGNDPTGQTNIINFDLIRKIEIKHLKNTSFSFPGMGVMGGGDKGYEFKITMLPDPTTGEIKEYWFRSTENISTASMWAGAIGSAAKSVPRGRWHGHNIPLELIKQDETDDYDHWGENIQLFRSEALARPGPTPGAGSAVSRFGEAPPLPPRSVPPQDPSLPPPLPPRDSPGQGGGYRKKKRTKKRTKKRKPMTKRRTKKRTKKHYNRYSRKIRRSYIKKTREI